jgi:hypothetical protein
MVRSSASCFFGETYCLIRTPLYDAATSHNITLCIELLKMKANPAARTEGNNTALHALV